MPFVLVTGGPVAAAAAPQVAIDPYDLLDPVNILNSIPKDFFEKAVSIFRL